MENQISKGLIQLAKNECCNYSDVGPFKKKHYCCYEPRQTDRECLILHGIPCKWFRDALLPLKPELKPDWETLLKHRDPFHITNDVAPPDLKECPCGATFVPRSNRQKSCPICSVKRRKIKDRARSKRYRARKARVVGQGVTL